VIQAASGLISIAARQTRGGAPTKVGVAISDVVSGMLAR
jgi:crotonobetainyl-CoA:carnitine CoA-transferase CaiB-like acyl-CoA transferase